MKALQGHEEYWAQGPPGRRRGVRRDGPDRPCLPAPDRGLAFRVTSDYMPEVVLSPAADLGMLACCPYCVTPLGDGVTLCPSCLGDTSKDAPIEMTRDEYLTPRGRPVRSAGPGPWSRRDLPGLPLPSVTEDEESGRTSGRQGPAWLVMGSLGA